MASRLRHREMAYGGFAIGWLARGDRRIGFGAKALVGFGAANFGDAGTPLRRDDFVFGQGPTRRDDDRFDTERDRFRNGFFVAEPEANVLVRLSHRVQLTGGVGYRAIGSKSRERRNELRGATGSVAVQIGGG